MGLFFVSTAQASAPVRMAPKKEAPKLSPKEYAKKLVADEAEFACLVRLWTLESQWNHLSRNKIPVYQVRDGKRVALHAFGIAQLLGETSRIPEIQIKKGLRYLEHRYNSSPCKALSFHLRHHWY